MLLFITLFLVLLHSVFSAQMSFELGKIKATPGTISSGFVQVPDGIDKGTQIPISIIQGLKPGPTLLLNAGIHGSEYVPIIALQRLLRMLNPKTISGTVMLVHLANPPAFYGRTIIWSPTDFKNLNRLFPGDLQGTCSDRIAHILSTVIIPRADVVIDMHCGDANEDLIPWTGYYAHIGSQELIKKSKRLATIFGVSRIVQFPFMLGNGVKETYLGPMALVKGIPTFDVEVGGLGQYQESMIEIVLNGVQNVMCEMGIQHGLVSPPTNINYISKRDHYSSNYDGIWYHLFSAGDKVEAGQTIGYITDVFANTVQEVIATNSGTILVIMARPAVNAGDSVLTVAVDE